MLQRTKNATAACCTCRRYSWVASKHGYHHPKCPRRGRPVRSERHPFLHQTSVPELCGTCGHVPARHRFVLPTEQWRRALYPFWCTNFRPRDLVRALNDADIYPHPSNVIRKLGQFGLIMKTDLREWSFTLMGSRWLLQQLPIQQGERHEGKR